VSVSPAAWRLFGASEACAQHAEPSSFFALQQESSEFEAAHFLIRSDPVDCFFPGNIRWAAMLQYRGPTYVAPGNAYRIAA